MPAAYLAALPSFFDACMARTGSMSLLGASLWGAILLLAIPLGGWLQRRRNAVPWYAHGRLIGHLSYATIGLALILLPAGAVIPAVLAIVAIAGFIIVGNNVRDEMTAVGGKIPTVVP